MKSSRNENLAEHFLHVDQEIFTNAYAIDDAEKLRQYIKAKSAARSKPFYLASAFRRIAVIAACFVLIFTAVWMIERIPAEAPDITDQPDPNDTTNEIELIPCIDNSMTFTSFSEMKEQITAVKTLPVTDERYAAYAALNLQSMERYYQPNLPTEFELLYIELTPFLMIYYYEIPGKTGIVYVQISRIQEEDPLLDIEKVTKQGRWKGYIFTGNTNWSDLYFSTSDGCLVKVSASRALLKELGLDNDEWKALENICSLENIQTVHINTTHVTE